MTGEHHRFAVRNCEVEFRIYVDSPGSAEKARQLAEVFFARVPNQHLRILDAYPIFVTLHKPGGSDGGGTFTPNEIARMAWSGRHESNTGIPSADFARHVQGRGMIVISKDRWERPLGPPGAHAGLAFTVMHEVGHVVDRSVPGGGLTAGATVADYAGMMTNRCGAGSLLARRAVEAYARYICRHPRIYHELPPGQTSEACNRRLVDTLRRSPAFRWEPWDRAF